jgi:hypothetical protein
MRGHERKVLGGKAPVLDWWFGARRTVSSSSRRRGTT